MAFVVIWNVDYQRELRRLYSISEFKCFIIRQEVYLFKRKMTHEHKSIQYAINTKAVFEIAATSTDGIIYKFFLFAYNVFDDNTIHF